NGTSPDASIWVNLTETDERSGIAEGDVDVRINGGSWVNTGLPNNGSTIDNFTYIGNNGSTYEFRYRVRDNAGNWSDYVYDGSVLIKINQAPTATNLDYTSTSFCATNPTYFFSWTYADPDNDKQTRFDFQIDNNSNFSSPEINRTISGLSNPSPSTNNQAVYLVLTATPDKIIYKTTYYWRVKVYDQPGLDSGWNNGSSFTTPARHFPEPAFDWTPSRPSVEEQVNFDSSDSLCYDNDYNGSPCSLDTNDRFDWTFQDGNPATANTPTPNTKFQSKGNKVVTLTITDGNNNSCTLSQSVPVRFPLPKWREVKP
ncbi:MAG: PKD domain-containing protein, partial [Patescibacteria group bacterium]